MKLLSDCHSRTFIAEACDNHFGSIDVAKAYIDAADEIGAHYIKFQHHLRHEEMDETNDMSDNFAEPLHKFLDRCALTLEDHRELMAYCKSKRVSYLCTPFSFAAMQELYALGNRLFKIGSGEFQDYLYLRKLADYKDCSFILSTGMCSSKEIQGTYEFLMGLGLDFALLNCVSEYPPKIGDPSFRFVGTMKKVFDEVPIGHSDHSPSIGSALGAITLGATIIEKHVTLSSYLSGPDKDVSITFDDFAALITLSEDIGPVEGEKSVSIAEEKVRSWAYRGLCYSRDIKVGQIITLSDITSKRPSKGIPSKDYSSVVGKVANYDLIAGDRASYKDFS